MQKSLSRTLVAVVAALGVWAMSPDVAQAQMPDMEGGGIGTEKKIGVGIGGGNPIQGLTGKFYLTSKSAVQAHVGFNTDTDATFLGAGVDYIIREINLVNFSFGKLDVNLGVGAYFGTYEEIVGIDESWIEIGPRAAVGPSLKLNAFPIEIALEYNPGFNIAIGNYEGTIGHGGLVFASGHTYIRYYF